MPADLRVGLTGGLASGKSTVARRMAEAGFHVVDADRLVAELYRPGGAGTRHLVDARVLAALGPKGYLVNTGRGTVVDTDALVDALRAGAIAGAGLDVLEGEPSIPPRLPQLLQFGNVIVTPHCAGRAPESRATATALILENLNAHFAGKPLRSPVPLEA